MEKLKREHREVGGDEEKIIPFEEVNKVVESWNGTKKWLRRGKSAMPNSYEDHWVEAYYLAHDGKEELIPGSLKDLCHPESDSGHHEDRMAA